MLTVKLTHIWHHSAGMVPFIIEGKAESLPKPGQPYQVSQTLEKATWTSPVAAAVKLAPKLYSVFTENSVYLLEVLS